MNNKILVIAIILLVLGAGALIMIQSESGTSRIPQTLSQPPASGTEPPHSHAVTSQRVPKYQSASEALDLPPTLPAANFFGKAKEAYRVAKEIPQTLAQLPCYCHCDQSFGHKSLHTCFVDDHAAQCAVCVDEALLAYRLQREEKMTPDQVRDRIIEKYSAEHQH